MTASVYVLGEDTRSHDEVAHRADSQRGEYRQKLVAAIIEGAEPEEILRFLEWYEGSAGIASQVYRRRTRKLETALRSVIGTDLSDKHVAQVLGVLYSAGGERRRNPGGLSDHEQQIVDAYRDTDGEGRQMLRTMSAKLRMSSTSDREAVSGD
jgi:hypothetical protein